MGICSRDRRHTPLACVLLNQIGYKQVRSVIWELFRGWPGLASLAAADQSELADLIRPCGLHNRRAVTLKKLSEGCCRPGWKDNPSVLYGVGKYAMVPIGRPCSRYLEWARTSKNWDSAMKISEITKHRLERRKYGTNENTFIVYDGLKEILTIITYVEGDSLVVSGIISHVKDDDPRFFRTRDTRSNFSHGVRLGTAETRRILRNIFDIVKKDHPQIKTISGNRITGARAGKRNNKTFLRFAESENRSSLSG